MVKLISALKAASKKIVLPNYHAVVAHAEAIHITHT
jgi:hypothetical protein